MDLTTYLIHWPTTRLICISKLSENADDLFSGRLAHTTWNAAERNGPEQTEIPIAGVA